ncbi:hypothetical protein [Intestinibacter sp.]|uniref:hypothetical protein n=1 Tax=Intestinibacter sp. TaxID=1965304 RepID=UPI002A762805|nr:hypothetical protein [Intestinibacter sp.]MDY2736861.1 hypothetical protein [Intestinibacter sp.]
MTKQEAINYINTLPEDKNIEINLMDEVISSKQVEQMGISRQLLKYHVKLGHVRTVPYGKQKRYLLEDIKKLAK